ncbi:hydrophobin [Gymnopilus junonius]|uniref:Hydrophobin n=1 Tax=Gymnopilus junonius TaxID=109634 RepID=A0A9P5NZZ7_GYMJU|nr:hydrophobin [Gymnopilus junonius]
MKFTTVAVILAAVAGSVQAKPAETNAQRLARGLPPLPPVRRATGVSAARRSSPSGISNSCNTGSVQCCNSVATTENPVVGLIAELLGIVIPAGVLVGLTCAGISVGGLGTNSWCACLLDSSQQPVCCENNSFNGLIAIGCTPSM